jgi:hypothetical protein
MKLLGWLEGEGERRRRKLPLPLVVGDAPARGWPHFWVCVLTGTLSAGLFVCWLVKARQQSGWRAREASVASRTLQTGTVITLADVRVEAIERGSGRRPPVFLSVNNKGLSIVCEFWQENVPRDVAVGDIVTVRASARDDGQTDRILFKDCEIARDFASPGK